MARKTPSEIAEAALDKLLAQREAARSKLFSIDEEIARMRGKLGGAPVQQFSHAPVEIEPVDDMGIPSEISPADNQGHGRWI